MVDVGSAPLAQIEPTTAEPVRVSSTAMRVREVKSNEKPVVMRKNMTRCLDEEMKNRPELVYIGEDVRHGG